MGAPAQPPYPRPAYAWYVVVVLLLAYVLAFVDREVIALLVPDIKHDLGVSDTRMSFLLGGEFAVFYTFFGVLIAWLADRGNRRWLIFGGVTVWSVMTMLCGLAMSYPALFLARVGVGAGEAALNPPALSLIKDYFPPDRMGRAIGLYTAGVSSGSGLAFISSAVASIRPCRQPERCAGRSSVSSSPGSGCSSGSVCPASCSPC